MKESGGEKSPQQKRTVFVHIVHKADRQLGRGGWREKKQKVSFGKGLGEKGGYL